MKGRPIKLQNIHAIVYTKFIQCLVPSKRC